MGSEGIAAATLVVYLAIVVVLVCRSTRRSPDGAGLWFLYIVERLFVGWMMKWRANNPPSNIPLDQGIIIIANHRSPVDPLLLWMHHDLPNRPRMLKCFEFMMASEYATIPGLRWLTTTMRSILVDRDGKDMAATREVLRRLKEGHIIGIFPEGGINLEKDLREANPGVAFLALKARVPVYPIYIDGAPQRGESMVAPFFTRTRVRVTYGDPIDLSEFYGQRLTQDKLAEVTNLLMRRLGELGGVGFTPINTET